MDFRKRLVVMFMIMTLFPILLLVSCGFIIIGYQTSVMKQAYDTEVNTLQALQETRNIFLIFTPWLPCRFYTDFEFIKRTTACLLRLKSWNYPVPFLCRSRITNITYGKWTFCCRNSSGRKDICIKEKTALRI